MQESIARVRPYSGRVEDCSALGRRKRAIDLLAVTGVAFLVLMLLIVLTAVRIRLLTSERLIGRGGRTFVRCKFRVPVANAKKRRLLG